MTRTDATTALDADDDGDGPGKPDDEAFASLLARLAATPSPGAPLLSAGARLGPFSLEVLLGRGGMDEVWRALDTRLHREVALKVLHPTTRGAVVLDEARAAAAVHHPRVATLFEVGQVEAHGTSGPLDWIALELVPGQTLRQRLRLGPLTIRDTLVVALDLAEGLAAVHARGLVHRDVKPDNLAVDASGHVKVLDFGIAAVAGVDANAWGTPRYLPPEQRAGARVDACADVFALGVTVIELLTGAAPFDDDGELRPELTGDPLRAARSTPNMPAGLIELLAQCVALDPAQRPADASVVVLRLLPLVHPRPSARERAAPFVLIGLAAALTVGFFTLATRVEDAVAADLPPALASAPVVSGDARVRARFRAAADAMLAGDDATAGATLAEVVSAEPGSPWAWALLVVTGETLRAGMSDAAAIAKVRRLADASSRDGRAALALVALAEARSLVGQQPIPPGSPAVRGGQSALDEAGPDAFSAVLLASLLPWTASVQEKLDRIDAGLSRDARVALLWLARADTLTAAGRPTEAAEAAHEGLARVPGNAALEDALLRARIAQGAFDDVEHALRERVRLRPDDLGARLLLLEVARGRGDDGAARVDAERLLDGPFPRAPAARAVARFALVSGDRAAAPAADPLLARALAALDEAGLSSLAASARAVVHDKQPEPDVPGR